MKSKYFLCLLPFLIVISMANKTYASPLDFSWCAPKTYVHNKGTKGELCYIVWFYNLKNTIDKTILVPIEVFLKTDTGEKYTDTYYPELMDQMKELDEDYFEGSVP